MKNSKDRVRAIQGRMGIPYVSMRSLASSFLLLSIWSFAEFARAQDLPFMTTAGILPLQIEGDSAEDHPSSFLNEIESVFSEAIKKSHRFRFLNSKLVKELWQSASGRKELKNDFEVHVFLGLSLIQKGDLIILTGRLLDTDLQSYAIETWRGFSKDWGREHLSATQTKIIQDLSFRLLNRLPLDLVVTSVQGKYVTLSGGSQQALIKGETYEVIRAKIAERHPVNGSWLKFDSTPTGTLKILEVGENSAVGEVVSANDTTAVLPGDGIKVDTTLSRASFQGVNESITSEGVIPPPRIISAGRGRPLPPEPINKIKEDYSVSPDLSQGHLAEPREQMPPKAMKAPEHASIRESNDAKDGNDPVLLPISDEVIETEPNLFDAGLDSIFSFMSLFPEKEFAPGIRLWNVKGRASSRGSLPLWLVNHARLIGRIPGNDSYDFEGFLSLDLGQTEGGLSNGFGLGAKLSNSVYDLDANSHLFISFGLDFDSRTTRGETYGGNDIFGFNVGAGVNGLINLFERNLEWKAGLKLYLLGTGRAGIRGKKLAVTGMGGSNLEGGLHALSTDGSRRIGGAVEINNRTIKTKKGSVTISEKIFLLRIIESF